MQPSSITLTAVRSTLTTAARLGAPVGKQVSADYDRLQDLTEKARTFSRDLNSRTGGAVLDALDAGTDPLTDPAVLRAVVGRSLDETRQATVDAIHERAAAFADQHGPAILAAFATPFDAAAQRLADACGPLANLDLTNPAAIARQGPEAAAAWAGVTSAESVVADIEGAWKLLGQATRAVPPVDKRYRILLIADVAPQTFVDEGLDQIAVRPFEAARRGWPLSLAGTDTYRERVEAVLAERDRARTEAAGAVDRAWRDQHRHPGVAEAITLT